MFSQVSVSHSFHGGGVGYLWSQILFRGGGMSSTRSRGGGGGTPWTWDWEGVPFRLLLTPSGSHHTYGQQADGTRPSGKLSYFFDLCRSSMYTLNRILCEPIWSDVALI